MPESDFEQRLHNERLEKLRQIAELGARHGLSAAEATYPNHFRFTTTVPELRAAFDAKTAEELEASRTEVAIAGRIMAIRLQGKAGFAQIQQGGQRLQIYVRKDDVGEDAFALYKLLDLGDHIGVTGYLMRTRTGELTVHVGPVSLPGHQAKPSLTFLAKAMLALPDKFHGLEDTELRYRQRYVDLFVNPDVRDTFVKRAAILRAIRRFFDDRGYLEVETPMLHTIAGGAAARPFKTHHNALDIPLSLRIAPELFLKRLVVGGMDRVYEINRNFRNEGVSTQHNPEFTMLEFYQAYANYHDLMDLTEELIKSVAMGVNGTTVAPSGELDSDGKPIPRVDQFGQAIDLSKWTRLTMRDAIVKWWPNHLPSLDPEVFTDRKTFLLFMEGASKVHQALVRGARFEEREFIDITDETVHEQYLRAVTPTEPFDDPLQLTGLFEFVVHFLSTGQPVGKAITQLFEGLAEPHLIQPTIIYDFPLAVSPLSKIKPSDPEWVERFEFYIGGFEVGNAFSELNDPDDQRARFEAQLLEKERGDDEAHAMDEDYVRALGYGLPPTAGEGIGIDRLTMILTGSKSIRDVILFPLMRPHTKAPE